MTEAQPMPWAEFPIDDFPSTLLRVWLFTDVQNGSAVRSQLISGTLGHEMALIDATLVTDPLTLQLAAHWALKAESLGSMHSRTLHTELVCGLSGSKHVGESLSRFGMAEGSRSVLVAVLGGDAAGVDACLREHLQGKAAALSLLPQLVDEKLLRKYYKISDEELKVGSLTDAIACRIAARDC
ncbi:kinase binding protein [Helicosporidium sp. ATCC 50920]|nr:kinase binding protein [Helicosporidium sp. ATCC 50920]|eukprot:KDD74364.1 kinase binding protein [Helicosporidium sp. ATCC 50920]